MIATAAITAAVIIPAGIGWLTRFGNIDWEKVALMLTDREAHARGSERWDTKPLATRRETEQAAARQREATARRATVEASLLRFDLPPRPVGGDPQLDAARAAEYEALRQRCQAEQATWNAEQRRWQRARAPLAEALVQADLNERRVLARRHAGGGGGDGAAEAAEAEAAEAATSSPELLAQCAPDGTGGGEAWLGYEEVGELRERQRRAFALRWNARLRAALDQETEHAGGGERKGARAADATGGAQAWGAAAEAGLEGWAEPGMLRVEARPIG